MTKLIKCKRNSPTKELVAKWEKDVQLKKDQVKALKQNKFAVLYGGKGHVQVREPKDGPHGKLVAKWEKDDKGDMVSVNLQSEASQVPAMRTCENATIPLSHYELNALEKHAIANSGIAWATILCLINMLRVAQHKESNPTYCHPNTSNRISRHDLMQVECKLETALQDRRDTDEMNETLERQSLKDQGIIKGLKTQVRNLGIKLRKLNKGTK